jgi:peptidase M28-like protein
MSDRPMPICRNISARAVALTSIAVLALVSPMPGQQAVTTYSTRESLKADIDAVPCKNQDRLTAVRALFVKMGAQDADISDDKYKNVENLLVRIKGASDQLIIIGAHYDKVPAGCGAIDNWSGIVTLTHLYHTLKSSSLAKTLIFVAFGREEDGLVGSKAMANAIAKDQVSNYCAMINIDSLGMGRAQVLDNVSTKKVGDAAEQLAKQLQIPFGRASVPEAGADSASFIARKIPAVTLHGLNNQWSSTLHTPADRPEKVDVDSVGLGYRLAVALVFEVDKNACGTYR